jgi:hypothetical protein
MKDNLKIKREERRREENPLRTPILVPAGLLIRRGSVPEAKLRMAKRLGRARAVTRGREGERKRLAKLCYLQAICSSHVALLYYKKHVMS